MQTRKIYADNRKSVIRNQVFSPRCRYQKSIAREIFQTLRRSQNDGEISKSICSLFEKVRRQTRNECVLAIVFRSILNTESYYCRARSTSSSLSLFSLSLLHLFFFFHYTESIHYRILLTGGINGCDTAEFDANHSR